MSLLLLLKSSAPPFVRITENSVRTYAGVIDAPMRESNPTTNYATADFQGNPRFEVGVNGLTDRTNTVIKFTGLSNVIGGTASNAKLRVYSIVNASSAVINLNAILSSFVVNQVTWNNYTTAGTWQTPGALGAADISSTVLATITASTAGQYYEFTGASLTAYINSIIGGAVDKGFLLSYANQANAGLVNTFYSSEAADGFRPELVFDYVTAALSSNDGADVSNAQLSPATSISSAVTDGADLTAAQLTSTISITSASNDGLDLSAAQLTSTTDVTSSAIDGKDTSNAQLTSSTAITSAAIDLADLSNAQLTSSTSITAVNTDGADRSNASVSPTASVSGVNNDGLDISIAALNPTSTISLNAIDGADLSNALIIPSGQSPSISSATVDGVDIGNAALAPSTSITSNVIDGLDYVTAASSDVAILSPAGYKYSGNHYIRRSSPSFPAYRPSVKVIASDLEAEPQLDINLMDSLALPSKKIDVKKTADSITVNKKLLVSIRAEKSRLNDEINQLYLLRLANEKRKKQAILMLIFEFI